MPSKEKLQNAVPQLIAELSLYPTAEGGRAGAIGLGWGCPCSLTKTLQEGYDGWPLLETPMEPGERRKVGFVFLSGQEAADLFRKAGTFYLWEGRFVGEAVVIS